MRYALKKILARYRRETAMDNLAAVRGIADPLERVRRAAELLDDAEEFRNEVIVEAYYQPEITQQMIGEAARLTGARVGQIVKDQQGKKGKPRPERALLAPDPGPVVFAVVQKQAADSGRPALAVTTHEALDSLISTAAALKISARDERIAPPGVIDLNRSNLAVLIGPRISALIAQALTADPVIKWSQDGRERWFITDTETGEQFHSEFDGGGSAGPEGERTCIAHIGRIRRPDGKGTFLYLGGAHSPGTAGAVKYFTENMPDLWEQAKGAAGWSAVVRTIAADNGTPLSASLVTPVRRHGRS